MGWQTGRRVEDVSCDRGMGWKFFVGHDFASCRDLFEVLVFGSDDAGVLGVIVDVTWCDLGTNPSSPAESLSINLRVKESWFYYSLHKQQTTDFLRRLCHNIMSSSSIKFTSRSLRKSIPPSRLRSPIAPTF